jgi:hypothetical protein
MTDTVHTTASSDIDSTAGAFARVADKIKAVDPAKTRAIRVDIALLVTIMLGSLPSLRTLRSELMKLHDFNVEDFDQIEDFIYALLYCHSEYLRRTKAPTELEALVPEATELRDMLYADAAALVQRKVFPEDALKDVKRGVGHRALFLDLQILSALFRAALATIQGRSAVSEAEVARAERLVIDVSGAVGARDHSPALVAESSQLRNQAYTAFLQRYDELRAAVEYVRRKQGDVEVFVPALFVAQGLRRSPKDDASPEPGASEPAQVDPPSGSHPLTSPSEQLANATFTR